MADDRLARVQDEAERSEPPVRVAALLRIARVQTAFGGDHARRTFQQALDEIRGLSGLEGEFLLEQARLLTAAVAPDLLREIPSVAREPRQFTSERLGRIMLEHEHGDAAYEYVMRYDDPSTFPFGLVSALMQWFGDEERQLAVLRSGIEAWRAAPDHRFGHRFVSVFQSAWKALPPEEAREVAREIVQVTLSHPDWPITATYDREQTVRITSGREHTLFTILHVLRRLDVKLAALRILLMHAARPSTAQILTAAVCASALCPLDLNRCGIANRSDRWSRPPRCSARSSRAATSG
jgi:hypothetical protein